MKAVHTLVIAASLLASAGAFAQQAAPSADHAGHHAEQAAGKPQSEGEVRKIDLALGKITLRHGPLANLDMPAMTMVFTASDPKLLEGLKEGDKVRFTADKKDGAYFVSAIERAE
ncbi:copper-binding protein [Ramlibacter sp. XY19]|uniref:copper-binding protein n=1 Tax=Ramlibacter paludis TaxID=2908000 RepID=UPI0023DC4742|nr:copper-binding protein [Ramlibacter paludis]MCG2594103.1 copper-binding protein [Ramlibacter paludis]